MRNAENVNAPWLGGFAIAAAAGLVAFGALVVVGKFDLTPAAAMALGVALVAGLILGMPGGSNSPSEAMTKAKPAAAPVAFAATSVAGAEGPARLNGPRGGKADNLKEIEGIGPATEKLVNEMGFYHFDQIAGWSDADVAWVDANMKNFKGRITRDRWVAQARIIVNEGLVAFRERAKTNNY
jgi:predicted flap endonuclease-1-like 5' DNA nuclease